MLNITTTQVKSLAHHYLVRAIRHPVLLLALFLMVGAPGTSCTSIGGAPADGPEPSGTPAISTPEQPRPEHLTSTETSVAQLAPSPTPNTATVAVTATPVVTTPPFVSEPQPTGHGEFQLPMRVRIPRIKVDAAIETVGLDSSGDMSPPRSHDDVAWYGYSPSPGAPGASVLAGHVDSVNGPSVFWSLRDLRPGDRIEVDLIGGVTEQFVVEGSGWYAVDEAPLLTIFSWDGPPRLHLITCGGVFDRERRTYNQRLIVYAHLEPSTRAQGSPPSQRVARSSAGPSHVSPFVAAR